MNDAMPTPEEFAENLAFLGDILSTSTPAPWQWGISPTNTLEEAVAYFRDAMAHHESGQFHLVFHETPNGETKLIAITGNGPTSPANARLIVLAKQVASRYIEIGQALVESWQAHAARPRIVCLCGSTRFWREFQRASLDETLAGRIVLSIGAASGTDEEHFGNLPREQYNEVKARLDELHLRKIDMADEVLVLNVGGYIGDSTRREVAYAQSLGRSIRWLEPDKALAPTNP